MLFLSKTDNLSQSPTPVCDNCTQMSHHMGKQSTCIGESKGTDQLDQRLCFRYTDSTIPLLLKSEISSFYLASLTVQPGLCWTCSKTTLLVFPRGGSNVNSRGVCIMYNHITRNDSESIQLRSPFRVGLNET